MSPKIILLFSVTIALFYLMMVPILYPFASPNFTSVAVGAAYFSWYLMMFILVLVWGNTVVKNGCWFFRNKD
jgi:archaellum biogenesis protein FlaJ (TadC family)